MCVCVRVCVRKFVRSCVRMCVGMGVCDKTEFLRSYSKKLNF